MAWDDNSDYGSWGADSLGTNSGMDMGRGDLGNLGNDFGGVSYGGGDAWGGGGGSDEPGWGTTLMGLIGGGLGLVTAGPFGAIAGYKGGRALAGYADDFYDYLSSGAASKSQQQAAASAIGGPGSSIDWGAVQSLMGSDNNNGNPAVPSQGQGGKAAYGASSSPFVVGQEGRWIDRKTGLEVSKIGDDAEGFGLFLDPTNGRTFNRDQVLKAGNPKAMSLFPDWDTRGQPTTPPTTPTGPVSPYPTSPPIDPSLTLTQNPQPTGSDQQALYDSMGIGHLPASGFGMERQWFQPNAAYEFVRTHAYGNSSAGGGNSGNSKYARGGHIEGPGTATSDSIPAMIDGEDPAALSDGEFVLTTSAVRGMGAGSHQRGVSNLYRLMHEAEQVDATAQRDAGFERAIAGLPPERQDIVRLDPAGFMRSHHARRAPAPSGPARGMSALELLSQEAARRAGRA